MDFFGSALLPNGIGLLQVITKYEVLYSTCTAQC